MADIQETLKESINEKTKSITIKDEFRKKGAKSSRERGGFVLRQVD
mgnify:CR=1 FL=1